MSGAMTMREMVLKKIQELLERNPDVAVKYSYVEFKAMTDGALVDEFEKVVVRCYRQR